jgi:hypothetical protein
MASERWNSFQVDKETDHTEYIHQTLETSIFLATSDEDRVSRNRGQVEGWNP